MLKNLVAAFAAACLLGGVAAAAGEGAAKPPKPLKIAFVYVTPLTPMGWVHQHELGRQALQAALGARVQTRYVENVPEGPDAERVIRNLARDGNQLIFTPSFGYMEPTLKVAKDFPDVKFENITGYKTAPNVAVANARYYEGRYLSGIVAGRMTKTHVAGYVAGFPIPEVLQGINAFALGMRSVDPRSQVKVVWTDSWFDPPRERDAAMSLIDRGADVLAFHTASTAVMLAAQQRGRFAIAYHSDMRSIAPDAQLVAVTHHWGAYDIARARAVLDGTWKSGSTWGGVKDGMIRLEGFAAVVPDAVRREVRSRERDLASGRLQPFAGPIDDNHGREVVAAGERPSERQIQAMDYLVAGVQGSLPAK